MDRTDLTSAGKSRRLSPIPHRVVVPTAILFGLTGNFLLRAPQGPGASLLLFFLALALAVRAATRGAGLAPSREAWSWMMAGVLLASGFVLRASPELQALAFLGAAAAFAFPALRAGAAWMWRGGVSDQVEAVVGAVLFTGLGVFRLVADRLSRGPAPADAGDAAPGRAPAILRGLLLAAPLLFVFGGLFMSADRVFAALVTDVLGTAVEDLASHVLVTGILAWLAAGYLTGFLNGTRLRGLLDVDLPRPSIGIVELGIALGLVDLLFAAFVGVQFRYLFGGAGLVEVTPGLTYAEYAREGFAQLALASALVLPALLASDWLLRARSRRDRAAFRLLGGLQLLLLGVVMLSAFQRVAAYQEAYGLTVSRFYGVAFLGWLALLAAWFAATVLRGRRDRFAFPALVSAFAVVAALFIANPDVWIARTNLTRAGLVGSDAVASATAAAAGPEGTGTSPAVDARYLGSLSADAVPVLLEALPRLRSEARCQLARRLLDRWGEGPDLDWRSWNRSVARARGTVRAQAAELRAMVGPGDACGAGELSAETSWVAPAAANVPASASPRPSRVSQTASAKASVH